MGKARVVKQTIASFLAQKPKKNKANGKNKIGNLTKKMKTRMSSAVIPYNATQIRPARTSLPGPQRSVDQVTRDNVFAVLQPKAALERGIEGRVNDTSMRPTKVLVTTQIATISCIANGTLSNDLYVEFYPFGVSKYATATAFALGIPTTMSAGSADPTYTSWSTFVDRVRCTCMEVQVSNASNILNFGGEAAYGRVSVDELPRTAYGNYAWATWAASKDVARKSIGKPGEVLKMIWLPMQGDSSNDWQFVAPTTAAGTKDTAMVVWIPTPYSATVFEQFTIEITAHFEVQVQVPYEQLYNPSTVIGDPAQGAALLAKALAVQPPAASARSAADPSQSAGEEPSVMKDLVTVYNGVNAAVQVGKQAYSWIKGLFSGRRREEQLMVALHNGLTLADLAAWQEIINVHFQEHKQPTRDTLVNELEQKAARFARVADLSKALGPEMAQATIDTYDRTKALLRAEASEEKARGKIRG